MNFESWDKQTYNIGLSWALYMDYINYPFKSQIFIDLSLDPLKMKFESWLIHKLEIESSWALSID
jgi:hypothetical protein